MTHDDRFGSLRQESNPFREQSRRHRNRGSHDGKRRHSSQRSQENSSESPNRMAEAFGAYLEQQLGSHRPPKSSAYLPPSRVNTSQKQTNSFKVAHRQPYEQTDINDDSAFPELKPTNKDMDQSEGTSSGWQANGVEMISKPTQYGNEELDSEEVRPGWVRLSTGKITYGPPSTHYERMIYHMLQARNTALNDLRRRHQEYKQYDYEMYGDRMLYEDRLGSFSDSEDENEDSSGGDSGSSSYDSDNDMPSDDWY